MWRTSPLPAQVALPVLVIQVAAPPHVEEGVDAVADLLHPSRRSCDHEVVHMGGYQRARGNVKEKLR
eukprot:15110015-Heterocapsa_arctica.AAC.1